MFCVLAFGQTKKVLIKSSPLLGERYVTQIKDINSIEKIFKDCFTERGFMLIDTSEVTQEIYMDEKFLSADVFIYQYPGNYPTINLILRADESVLYSEEAFVKIFTDRQSANERNAQTICKSIPNYSDLSQEVEEHNPLIRKNRLDLNSIASNAFVEMFVNNLRINFEFDRETNVSFAYDVSIEEYLKNVVNLVGIRSKLKGRKIVLQVEIDKYGFTHLKSKELPIKLKQKLLDRIDTYLLGFPIWINPDGESVTATIKVGAK